VHHLDIWIKIDQLDVTCFIIPLFNAQHVSDVNTSILRSLRLICWVISWLVLLWYDVCWCYVVVWLGWCGITSFFISLFNAQHPDAGWSLHPDTKPPQPNHNLTPTHIVPEQYNPWNNSTNKSQASEDGCINTQDMLSMKYWNKKARKHQVGLSFFNCVCSSAENYLGRYQCKILINHRNKDL